MSFLFFLVLIVSTHPLGYQENNLAYAHIFGEDQTIKNIDK